MQIESWLLKVSISLERGDIFQHKAVLSYLTLTYSCHLLPSCLQVAFKMAQDRNLGPTWPQLGSSWAQLGLILRPKMSISCGRGCIFWRFGDMRLETSEIAWRWPPRAAQEGPRAPQEPQGGPKTAPRATKMAPRRPQDGPETAPRRLRVASKSLSNSTLCYLNFNISQNAPKTAQAPPQGAPRGPQGAPKRPQEARKRPPRSPKTHQRGPQEAPSWTWKWAFHVRGLHFSFILIINDDHK